MTLMPWSKRALLHKPKAICRGPQAFVAPLRPSAGDPTGWEQISYQAILERRPAEIISRLKELLTTPDPNIGYLNGELRFWLGWAQEVAGDNDAARETWRQARGELEALVKDQPENWALLDDLALTTASLGDKAAALALVERVIALNPIEKQAREWDAIARDACPSSDARGRT